MIRMGYALQTSGRSSYSEQTPFPLPSLRNSMHSPFGFSTSTLTESPPLAMVLVRRSMFGIELCRRSRSFSVTTGPPKRQQNVPQRRQMNLIPTPSIVPGFKRSRLTENAPSSDSQLHLLQVACLCLCRVEEHGRTHIKGRSSPVIGLDVRVRMIWDSSQRYVKSLTFRNAGCPENRKRIILIYHSSVRTS